MATAPGKSFREGLTIVDPMCMFPTEDAARNWFEQLRWLQDQCCRTSGKPPSATATNHQ